MSVPVAHSWNIYWISVHLYIFINCYIQAVILKFAGVYSASQDVEDHLAMGKKLLAAGQLAEALSHYHAAVGKIICWKQETPVSNSLNVVQENLCNVEME